MIGLKRGTIKLCEHEKEWETEAQNTISRLKQILGNVIKDIQHVGSTSIRSIKAKPIIDIAVAVDDFDNMLRFEKELKDNGFYYRPNAQASVRGQLLFACGNFYGGYICSVSIQREIWENFCKRETAQFSFQLHYCQLHIIKNCFPREKKIMQSMQNPHLM